MKRAMLLALMLFIFSGCSQSFPEPTDTLSKFIAHWNTGSYDEMYKYLSEEAKAENSIETFSKRYKNISEGIGLETVSLQSVVPDEEVEDAITYTLQFETTTVGQFSQDYSLTLVKGENEWLMHWNHSHILPSLTADRTIRVKRQRPKRGIITDRNNVPLVYQGEVREIGVVPGRIQNEVHLVAVLAAQLQMSEDSIRKLLNQSWVKPDLFVPIKKITIGDWEEKKNVILALPGVLINRAESRVYDLPQSFAQTIGYLSEITAEQLQELHNSGYRTGDFLGVSGLETHYEDLLAGTIGFSILINDQAGQLVEVVAEKKPADGQNLSLTVDKELMNAADAALGRNSGSIIVLHAQSGDVLALASRPGFDSNLFSLGITREQYQTLKLLNSPFLNRTLSSLVPPGSIFKPFTALMALKDDVFNPEEAWDTPKQWQPDTSWGGYRVSRVERPTGPVDLYKGMKWSDNIYFANLSLKVGWDRFIMHAQSLGFGKEIPFPLPVKTSQTIKSAKRDMLLADSGYGQGELQVTPLHMALMYTALARGDGNIPVPRISVADDSSIWLETGFTQDQLATVDNVLKAAVQDEDALAYLGNVWDIDIRGKTGTAQITATRQIGWFACYFDDYVIVAALEGDQSLTSLQAVDAAKTLLELINNL